jgi:hypothetical protein
LPLPGHRLGSAPATIQSVDYEQNQDLPIW